MDAGIVKKFLYEWSFSHIFVLISKSVLEEELINICDSNADALVE